MYADREDGAGDVRNERRSLVMWALIRREIEEVWVYYLLMILFAGILIILMVSNTLYGKGWDSDGNTVCLSFGSVASCMLFAALGVTQMYGDRMKKISAFLATQAVCRRHLFFAKLAAGVLLAVIFYAAVGGTVWFLSRAYGHPGFSGGRFLIRFSVSAFVMSLGCYTLGLSMGWTSGKIFPTLGTLVLVFILLTLLLIKGQDLHLHFLLVLFIVSTLIRTWLVYRHSAF
jgi:hypothetical protein